ncbi:MAG: hypothetical protein KF901_17120 [Myxococcales bacterium]|nr:hypothetical protein [Myxococcales bacterium]
MRLGLVTTLLLALSPVTAEADSCVCWTGLDASESRARSTEVSTLEAPAIAPMRPLTLRLDPDALSRPIEDITSRMPDPPERVLWCDGGDDPRCAPGNPAPPSASVATTPPAALTQAQAARSGRPSESTRSARVGLSHARGVRFGLVRPPR